MAREEYLVHREAGLGPGSCSWPEGELRLGEFLIEVGLAEAGIDEGVDPDREEPREVFVEGGEAVGRIVEARGAADGRARLVEEGPDLLVGVPADPRAIVLEAERLVAGASRRSRPRSRLG